jgi:hypothetical protein
MYRRLAQLRTAEQFAEHIRSLASNSISTLN